MPVPDVLDLALGQHGQIRRLCGQVGETGEVGRELRFAELARLVNIHERGDLAVIHPMARSHTTAGDEVVVTCMAEEGSIEREFAGLLALGVDHVDFEPRFAALKIAIDNHLAYEEREEFTLLRLYVQPQRLHMMAGQLHDVQMMDSD
jgi:hypothetical protein